MDLKARKNSESDRAGRQPGGEEAKSKSPRENKESAHHAMRSSVKVSEGPSSRLSGGCWSPARGGLERPRRRLVRGIVVVYGSARNQPQNGQSRDK
jgi:hypothetical protein